MNSVAIVAAGPDARFAEQVRAGLQAAGREASVQQQLPSDSSGHVVLIWSAALEAAHAIDAQALIGLWSEGHLTVARRDATPLPLGLRDLPSLGPETTVEAVCAAALGSARAPSAKPRSHALTGLVVLASVVLVLSGSWYYVTGEQRARQSALTAALEEASKAAEDLKAAQAQRLIALKKMEDARVAELAARRAGDEAKLREAESAVKIASSEMAKQEEFIRQREAAAADARKQAQDAASSAKMAAAPAKEAKTEVAAVAPKAEAPAPKAEAPKAEARAPSAPMSRSERERLVDEEAARKALVKAGRAPEKEQTQVAASSPAPAATAAAPSPATSQAELDALYRQALAMENGGDAKGAIRIYRRAARAGSGKAARRLGEIFDRGVAGVPRDYAESLQWYETAKQLGEKVEMSGRDGRSATEIIAAEKARAPAPASEPKSAAPEPAKAAAPAPAAAAKSAPEPAPSSDYAFLWAIGAVLVVGGALFTWVRVQQRSAPAAPSASAAHGTSAVPAQSPADGAMLFVSYSHKDRTRVEPIVSAIEQMGRRVWMDRSDITGQTGWAGQIVRAIRECRAVVLMASPNSYSSDQVVRELYLAMNHKKAIVPIEIEPAEMPDELQYILAPFQHHRLSGGETRAVLGRALAAI